jgi:hypothetical protein
VEIEAQDVVVEPSISVDDKQTEPNTPEGTAPEGVVEEKQAEPAKTFTQAEVDAMVQKRLLKEERRVHRRIEQQLREQQEAKAREVAPKRESFQDDDAYLQAQIEHLAEQRAAEKIAIREQQSKHEKVQEAFLEKAEKAIERYPDFQAVVGNPELAINDAMAEFISDSDQGPDVAYFLGKNPMRAAQIAQMTPVKATVALLQIEAELSAKPKPRPSNAPAPITPIGGASGATKPTGDMTDEEYAKWRRTARS